MTETKTCPRCQQALPETAYSPASWLEAWHPCRECRSATYKALPQEVKAKRSRQAADRYRASPELRAKQAAYHVRARTTPEGKAKLAAQYAERVATSEGKAKFAAQSADYHQRRKYGITYAEKEAMIDAQGGLCRCCGVTLDEMRRATTPCTDHTVGRNGEIIVRGIICHPCNAAIGMLGDDLAGVLNAVRYLMGVE